MIQIIIIIISSSSSSSSIIIMNMQVPPRLLGNYISFYLLWSQRSEPNSNKSYSVVWKND